MALRSLFPVLLVAACMWAQENGTVQGTVTNALTGEPLLRARVTLNGMSGRTRRNLAAMTDAEGKFSLEAPEGTYAATAERVGFTTTADRQGRAGAQVTVRAGDKAEVKLKLNPNSAISGKVTDADGEPVEGVTVSAEGGPARGMMPSATTDDKGQFRLSGLPPGRYRVKAHPMNQSLPPEIRSDGSAEVHYAQTYYPNSLTAKGASRVAVGVGAEVGGIGIQLVRTPIVRVSGTVTGAPAGQRVMVEAMSPNFGARQTGFLREDGTFEIWRLDPGKYMVSASAMENGLNLRSAAAEVEVSGMNVDHVELHIAPPVDIAGQVEYDDEQARQGPQPPATRGRQQSAQPPTAPPLTLLLRDTSGRSYTQAHVGADGSFKLDNVSPGHYRVSTMWNGVYVKSMRLGQSGIDGNVVDIGGAGGGTLTVLLSSAVGEISGVVTDDKGPVAQVPVAAIVTDSGAPMFPGMTMTGDDGTYRLTGLAPGKYKLLATEDNLWSRAQDDDTEEAETIEIGQGDKLTRDLKLRPAGGN